MMRVNLYGVMPGLGWTSMEIVARSYEEALKKADCDVRTFFPPHRKNLKFFEKTSLFLEI